MWWSYDNYVADGELSAFSLSFPELHYSIMLSLPLPNNKSTNSLQAI